MRDLIRNTSYNRERRVKGKNTGKGSNELIHEVGEDQGSKAQVRHKSGSG